MYKIIGADQKEYGPVSEAELRRWIAEGRVGAQTLIQMEGQTDWRPLSSFPHLATVAQTIPGSIFLPSPSMPSVNFQGLVNGPATGLMVVGILCALASIVGAVGNLLGLGAGAAGNPAPANLPPQFNQYMQFMSGGVGLVFNFVGLALSGFFIYASTKMRKLESYGMVMTATVLSMLPCTSSCCCVGLPIGIWILVVLSKQEVKSAFH